MALRQRPALVALTPGGLALARRIRAALPAAEVCGLKDRTTGADREFESVTAELQALFRAGRPIIGLCAAGILIRALASLLDDKRHEPPVLALAEDGSTVVPLLGGHRGANQLARRLAALLGVAPAITTAGELAFAVALDEPPPGWRLANPDDHKAFAAALLAGARVRLDGDAAWLSTSLLPFAAEADLAIEVTDRAIAGSARTLVYHPAVLAVGVGCERGTVPAELVVLVRDTLADHGLAEPAVAAI